MVRSDKIDAVNELSARFNSATAAVVTEYRGLSMAQLTELRRSLGEGATYRVAKNTLVKRAVKESGIEGMDDMFVGPTAIAFIEGEPVDAAKALKNFAKDNKALVIKGGYMEGRPISVSDVEAIADLDSREVTLSKLAGVLKAKLSQTARMLSEPGAKVARAVSALEEQKSA